VTEQTFAGDSQDGALTELVGLLLTTSGVERFLQDLTVAAAGLTTRQAGSCGVTLRHVGGALTVASSDSFARAVDEVQYQRGAGPCLQALDSGLEVAMPDSEAETRWGGYPAQAAKHGVRSSLSLPLTVDDRTVGAMNHYSSSPHAFDDDDTLSRARGLAGYTGTLLGVVLHQSVQAELTDQLRQALATRSVIDQAMGILMAQRGCTSEEAFALLRRTSQDSNRKLRDIATIVVTATSGQPPTRTPFRDPH
jgi:GAF domain-containing protein